MKKRNFTGILLAAAVLTAALPAEGIDAAEIRTAETAAEEQDDQVIIYHTNDTHGALAGGDGSVSVAQAAALKKQSDHAILVDAGDATQGLPLASLTKGADAIRLMNEAGYDAMCAGNHEFDFGVEQLLENAAAADFPMLAANITYEGSPIFADEDSNGCSTVVEAGGRRVGVIGITTKDTATKANPEGTQGVSFGDEAEAVKEQVDVLEEEDVDAVVVLAHLGDEADTSCTGEDLAEALTGTYQDKVDVIIDGHSHTVENKEVNGVLIVQTGYNMSAIGKVTLQFEDGEVIASEELLTADSPEISSVEPDPDTQELLNEITASQEELLGEAVCSSDITFWGGWVENAAVSRRAQTSLGELSARALQYQAEKLMDILPEEDAASYENAPVIAVENGGGVRDSLRNGTVTKGDILTVFPFSNTTVIKEITPAVLYEMLEWSVHTHTAQDPETGCVTASDDGGYLQIAGFSFTYDPSMPEGSKVKSVWLSDEGKNGTALNREDNETVLILACNSFLAAGGNDYSMLPSCTTIGEGVGEAEAIEEMIDVLLTDGKEFLDSGDAVLLYGALPETEGYTAEAYTAYIRITDEEGEALKNAEVTFYLDGVPKEEIGLTDADGFLAVAGLEPGEHSVRLEWEQNDVYVNNYTGIGLEETEAFSWPALTWTAAEDGNVPDGDRTPDGGNSESGDDSRNPSGTDGSQSADKDKDQISAASGSSSSAVKTVRTGDQSSPAVYVVLLIVAAAAVIICIIVIRRRRK